MKHYLKSILTSFIFVSLLFGPAKPSFGQDDIPSVVPNPSYRCSRFLNTVLPAVRAQMTPGFVIQSAVDAYIMYLVAIQTSEIFGLSDDLIETYLDCPSSTVCFSHDIPCSAVVEMIERVKERAVWSMSLGTYQSVITSSLLSLINTLPYNIRTKIFNNYFELPFAVFESVVLLDQWYTPPALSDSQISYLNSVPLKASQSLAKVTQAHSQVLIATGSALAIRGLRAIYKWVIPR